MKLHLTHDNIFIDNIIKVCDEFSLLDDHKFVVFPNDDGKEIKFVRSDAALKAVYDSPEFWQAIGDWKKYSTVYIHWLWDRTQQLVLQIPKEIKVVWCFWGGDGLEIPELLDYVYQPKTAKYYRFNKNIKPFFTFNIKKLKQHIYESYVYLPRFYKQHKLAVQRIDYFAHYLPFDFQVVQKVNDSQMKMLPFHYACMEDLVTLSQQIYIPAGKHIILGNSDTETNNHLEAIDVLSANELADYTIYCPLSYEGKKYAKDIAEYGKKKLGKQFLPLLEFLPRIEYEKILSQSKVAIMNHNRSQALGNLAILLCNGTRVYMSKDSALFKFFKENNIHVYSLQDDYSDKNSWYLESLSKQEIEENRKSMFQLFGREHYKEKLKLLFNIGGE